MKYFIINGLYLNKDFSSLSEEPDEDDIFYQNFNRDHSFSLCNQNHEFFEDCKKNPIRFIFEKDSLYYYPGFIKDKVKFYMNSENKRFIFKHD